MMRGEFEKRLAGIYGPAEPYKLSTWSLDELWDVYDNIRIISQHDIEWAEWLRRLIGLRTPDDGWHYGHMTDFYIGSDLTTIAASDGSFSLTANSLKFTEGATPSAAFDAKLTTPAGYIIEVLGGCVYLGDQDASVTISATVNTAGGQPVTEIVSEALDASQKFAASEAAGRFAFPPAAPPSTYIRFYSSGAIDALSVAQLWLLLRWKRLPLWVVRA